MKLCMIVQHSLSPSNQATHKQTKLIKLFTKQTSMGMTNSTYGYQVS